MLEMHISLIWKNFLDRHFTISGDRKKRLEGRDFTVSVRLEMLEVAGAITSDDLAQLTVVRQSRNDLVHEGQVRATRPPIEKTCKEALMLLREMFRKQHRIDLSYSADEHGTPGL